MHVISTAGHVDHGKSTLIRTLTGIDPDRFAEEKARGLTIDLGFAWMNLPSGREIGIVDVPGHERFIHNMLAGVGSVHLTIFVVAANEGWMPQTEEHLAILEMLGAGGGVVALTKSDLISSDELAEVQGQIRGRLAGTALGDAEIVPVSGTTGSGIFALLRAIDELLDRVGDEQDVGRPRVFLDRIFTVKGAGTVVTGTLTGGKLRIDDHVVVLPGGHRTRIRGIQTHRRVIDEAHPISRVALNIVGADRADLARGDAVVLPGQWHPTTDLDVQLRAVRSLDHPITNRGAFKAYIGSAEVDVRLSLYEEQSIRPGGSGFARLTLAHPVVGAPLDRFVLRDSGRRATVGGGVILDAHPPTLKGLARGTRPEQLRARATATADQMATLVVGERGVVPRIDLPWLAGTDAAPGDSVSLRTLEVSRALFDELAAAIERALADFHARAPLVRGMGREEAREAAGVKNARLFAEIVEARGDRIVGDGSLLRLASHTVTLTLEQEGARDILLKQLDDAGFSPPSLQSLISAHGEPLVRALIDTGVLTQISDDLVFAAARIDEAKATIAAATQREGALTASRVRELLATSRKYAIPLLEYLDATGFTRRRGDVREVVGSR